jgi:hypothetical protein
MGRAGRPWPFYRLFSVASVYYRQLEDASENHVEVSRVRRIHWRANVIAISSLS